MSEPLQETVDNVEDAVDALASSVKTFVEHTDKSLGKLSEAIMHLAHAKPAEAIESVAEGGKEAVSGATEAGKEVVGAAGEVVETPLSAVEDVTETAVGKRRGFRRRRG